MTKQSVQLLKITMVFIFGLVNFGCERSSEHRPLPVKKQAASGKEVKGASAAAGAETDVTFAEIRGVLQARCNRCHPGMHPKNWLDENQAMDAVRSGSFRNRLQGDDPAMPIKGTAEAQAITPAERKLLLSWVATQERKLGIGGAKKAAPLAAAPEKAPAPAAAKAPALASAPATSTETTPPPNISAAAGGVAEIVVSCASCHGENGVSKQSSIPNLAAQRADYLEAQLKAFRGDQRQDKVMNSMNALAKNLTDEDISAIAKFFAALKPEQTLDLQPSSRTNMLLAARGQSFNGIGACLSCHSGQVMGEKAEVPSLAGQKVDYLVNQFKAFKDGERKSSKNGLMNVIMAAQPWMKSEEDMKAVAHYFYLLPR